MDRNLKAFTIVEMLVVVTIITVLLSMLAPAIDRAIATAERAKCLANVRTTAVGCLEYAFEFKKTLPIYTAQNEGRSSAYDWRTFDPAPLGPRYPLSIGLLVDTRFLPSGPQLGKVAHCPNLDNKGDPVLPGHCMDVVHANGWGASFWSENPGYRIIGGYSYRAASFYNAGKGNIRSSNVAQDFLLYVDVPDVRFRGHQSVYTHADGYSRGFGDGSASFLLDPAFEIERQLMTFSPPQGTMDGGVSSPAASEEQLWDYMARGSVAE